VAADRSILEYREIPVDVLPMAKARGLRRPGFGSRASRDSVPWSREAYLAAYLGAGHRPTGYLFLVPEALEEAWVEALRIQQALGVPVRRLSVQEAQALVPFRGEGIALATFGPMDGVIDSHGATAFYLRRARALGAEVRYAEPLLEAPRRREGWRVRTPKGVYEAPELPLATGA